jgi:hypothetical protein
VHHDWLPNNDLFWSLQGDLFSFQRQASDLRQPMLYVYIARATPKMYSTIQAKPAPTTVNSLRSSVSPYLFISYLHASLPKKERYIATVIIDILQMTE